MKKYLLIYLFILGLAFTGKAQLLLTLPNGDDVSNDTIKITASVEETYLKQVVLLTNDLDKAIEVNVTKIEVDVVENSYNSFCWNASCLPPDVYESPEPLIIEAGETSGEDDFYTEFLPNEQTGISVVTYKFHGKDSFDEVRVTFVFEIYQQSNSSESVFSNWKFLQAQPNPAIKQTWINYSISQNVQNAQIVIRNLLGNILIIKLIDPALNKLHIDVSGLNNGIYIYSLEIDKQVVSSKRLIVAN